MGRNRWCVSICCIVLTTTCLMTGGAVTTDTVDFVIISPAGFVDALTPLVVHKQSHGIVTKVVTLDEISLGVYFPVVGRDAAEEIKYFIRDAYETWDTRAVLLVGGKEVMPVRETRSCFPGTNTSPSYIYYLSDVYFADLYFQNGSFCSWDSNHDMVFADKDQSGFVDAVDLYPDVTVGRILTNSESEIATVVDKIMVYENTSYGASWFPNLVVCGADDARSLLLEAALPFLLGRVGFPVFEGEYLGNAAARMLSDFSVKKVYGTGFVRPSSEALTVDNINNAVSAGAGFLMFNGHGSPGTAILTNFPFLKRVWLPKPHQYTVLDVDALSNGYRLPMALFGGCNCGDFNTSSCPIAWKFVAHESGGAVASVACTAGATMVLGSLCRESFHGYLLMQMFEGYAEGTRCVGDLWADSISSYLDDAQVMELGERFSEFNWRNPVANHYVLEQWTLFGDPTLRIGGYP